MGTRADFYVGRGEGAEWLGSVAWDGHPENFKPIFKAKTEAQFRKAVAKEFASRDDATLPAAGWPWPWNDSHLTDYSYAFDSGLVFHTEHVKNAEHCAACDYEKKVWVRPSAKRDDEGYVTGQHHGVSEFPRMGSKKMAPAGSKRSGVIVLGL